VIACHAATKLGMSTSAMRQDLRSAMRAWTPDELLYYDPRIAPPPDDVPEDCRCGRENPQGQRRCAACHRHLDACSRYEIWYYALMAAFFCEHQRMPLRVSVVDILRQVVVLRPLPTPDSADFYQGIYAVTHLVYALTHYGRWRLCGDLVPEERRFLRSALDWAISQQQPDTVGEIVDSLVTLGVDDGDPMLGRARAFLLEAQEPDGGWGDENGDDYARFHTVWTGLDGVREYRARPYRRHGDAVQRAIRSGRSTTARDRRCEPSLR
jgi:hypothetical protein